MSEIKEKSPPAEVQEMRRQLAEVRRAVRGVKDSARNLRAIPKSERLSRLTDAAMQDYDSQNPQAPSDDATTRRLR